MNAKFNTRIPNQELNDPLMNLEKYVPQFEKMLNKSESYRELIFKIDRFLKKIKHKPYYG